MVAFPSLWLYDYKKQFAVTQYPVLKHACTGRGRSSLTHHWLNGQMASVLDNMCSEVIFLPFTASKRSLIALALSASARCPHVSGSSLNFSLTVIISLRQAPWASLFLDFISSNSSPGTSSSIPRSYHLSLIGYRKSLKYFREIASAILIVFNS